MPAVRMLALLAACALAACKSVGPDFKEPQEAVPDRYAEASARRDSAGSTANPAPAGGGDATGSTGPGGSTGAHGTPGSNAGSFWWQQFHDPELDRLEQRTRDGNLDLKVAYLRIVESRAQVQAARAQGLPSLNASAAYTREQLGAAGILKEEGIGTGAGAGATASPTAQALISTLEKPVNLYQIGFDASWELDLFGRVRRSVEAAKAQSEESVESKNDLLVTLQGEVAQTYLQLRSGQVLQGITRALIAEQKQVLELTKSRQMHGLAGQGDVESATAQLANLESQLPPYDQTVATSRHALAVLTGQVPEALDTEFGAAGELPPLPDGVDVGIPSTLARRRPDVRSSEAALHAATAQVGVSVASLFPDISLSGTFGLRNIGTGSLFDWASHFYTAGPSISMPIFHGGALVANVRMSRAEAAEAALNYRKTVLGALQEVEDGLVSLHDDAGRSDALRVAVGADQRALEIGLDAYKRGLSTYISVLTVQLQADQARQQLAQAELAQSTDVVKLYKALGGDYPTSANQP